MNLQESFNDLRKHSVVKAFTIYIIVAWGALQAIDIIFPIIGLTAYYQRWFLLIALIGLPITLLFAWVNANSTLKKTIKRKSIAWGLTVFISVAGLLIGYNVIGESITQIVAIENEAGETELFEVLQDKYVQGVVLFPFQNLATQEEFDWVGNWIVIGLGADLNEFTYINPIYGISNDITLGKMQSYANNNGGKYFLEGAYELDKDSISVNMKMYDASNAKLIDESIKTIEFSQLSGYIDSLSLKVRQWTGLSKSIIDSEVDLRIAETLTKNDSAAKYFSVGNYQKAIYYDSTFAMAALQAAQQCYNYQCGKENNIELIDIAMKNRARLGTTGKLFTLLMYYAINEERTKAIRLLDNQLILKSKNLSLLSIRLLFSEMWSLDDYFTYFSKIQSLKQMSQGEHANAIEVLVNLERFDEAKKLAEMYKKQHPEAMKWDVTLGTAYMVSGEFDNALIAFENYELNNPDDQYISYLIEAAEYHKEKPMKELLNNLQQFTNSYKITYSELTMDVKVIEHFLKIQGDNQRAFNMLMINDSTCIQYFRREDYGSFLKLMLVGKENEHIDQLAYWQIANQNNDYKIPDTPNKYWYKESESLDTALVLLKNDELQLAKKYLNEALQEHPDYYFIKDYLSHVEFMTSEQFSEKRYNLDELEGTYGQRQLFRKNGHLYYRRMGVTQDQRVYQMTAGFLKLASNNRFLLQVISDDNAIIGLQGWYLNMATMQYERLEVDYSKKTNQQGLTL